MNFTKIDFPTWPRKDTYDHFSKDVPCTYSMTVQVDITDLLCRLRQKKQKLFPAILYGITRIVNQFPEFRMDFDAEGNLGFYDVSNPCYTVFHKETETFTNVWTEYDQNYSAFLAHYERDMVSYQADVQNSKPTEGNNLFNVSCIPWSSFTGFNLNLQNGFQYFPPIFTIGKYFEENGRVLLPLAIQVNHAVCDGFHLARFVNELQEWANGFYG